MAATTGTYYFSSASFSNATALYLDEALSTFAPDGWYSDQTIYRQQASGILYAETTCPNCLSPSPSPAPISFDYRIYEACDGVSGTQVFRVVTAGVFPATVLYNNICYFNPQSTGLTSTINVSGLPSYVDCTACSPAPTPTPGPTPGPTPAPAVSYDYREYTECGGVNTQIFRVVSGGVFPNVLQYNSLCWENPQATGSTSTVDVSGLSSFNDCASCGTATFEYREYTDCSSSSTQVFRVETGQSFPNVVTYNAICWSNPQATGSTSTIDATSLPSYVDCTACLPTPAPTTAPGPTPAPAVSYDYKVYSDCFGTGDTEVFRIISGNSFPVVVKFNDKCWDNPQTTVLTSTNDVAGLLDFVDCATCLATTPSPAPTTAPTPTPAPTAAPVGTQLFSTNTEGSGQGSSGAACLLQTSVSIYTSRANVASVQVNDVLFTNVGLSNIWNGGLKWYGVTNVNGHYPDLDNGYAFLINSSGVVINIVNCAPTPAPTVAPTAPSFQDIQIRQCFTTSPLYYVRVTGLAAPTLSNGNSIKITGPASSPNPQFTGTTCWEIVDDASIYHDSNVTLNTIDSSCSGCGAVPQYDYAEYTECQTSTTQVFRKLTTTASFPSFVEYNNICYSSPVTTTQTTTIDVESLTSFNNCFDCENPSMFINGLPQQGYTEAAACNARTDYFVFSDRATVGQIIVGDTLYANSSKTTVFNGGFEWYSISNTLGLLPQPSNDKYLINSSGVVQTITTCAVAPTTAPVAPTAAPTTNIEVEDCNNPGPGSRAYVTVNGTFGTNAIGLALKLSGGTGGSCSPGFDGTKCWEIKAVNTISDCSSTVLSVNTDCNSCTPVVPTASPTVAPTNPPTTPTPVVSNYYYSVSICSVGTPVYTQIVSSTILNIGQSVLMPDGFCYIIEDVPATINSNAYVTAYVDCTTCVNTQPTPAPSQPAPPPPTVAPTPAPTAAPTVAPTINCFGLTGSRSTISGADACQSTRVDTHYFDTSDLCTATVYYGTTSGCNVIYTSAAYVSIGGNERLWNGSTFTTLCTPCP